MKKICTIFAFFLLWVGFSYPFFLKHQVAAPLDFLVNFFTPWDKYYDSPIKNSAVSDVVNQILPWKTYTIWSLKQGKIPLWNPYNLAGSPHLANWQSAVLYPTNLLFFFLQFTDAWSFHVLLQPLLAGFFMILYLRSLRLSQWVSFFGAIIFSHGGFMTVWMEWGTLGHAFLWLPLALYGIEKRRNLVIIVSWVMSLFAGHLQISLYIIGTSIAYFVFRNWSLYRSKLRDLLLTVCCLLFPTFLLASPQILPAIHLFLNSYRIFSFDPEWFKAFRIPSYGLLTFLAPDFFGNPVTRNHWSDHSYIEMMGYIGLIPMFLALYSLLNFRMIRKEGKQTLKFFFFVIIIGLLFSLKTPIANIIVFLRVPVLASSSPARMMSIISFSLVIFSAYGFDLLLKSLKEKKLLAFFQTGGVVMILFAGMWVWSFLSLNQNALVARHNLILPTTIFLFFVAGVFVFRSMSGQLRILLLTVFCLLLVIFDLFRFYHKFTPFIDQKYFYPAVPVIEFLQHHEGRVFGLFDANMNLPFRISTIEGYDPLVLKDYVTYTSQAETGKINLPIRTSAVQLPKNGKNTIKILNELGVKYVVQPTVHGAAPWELHLWEYSDQFQVVYRDDQYEVYENLLAKQRIEPYEYLLPVQKKLFIAGIAMSGITLLGMIIWHKKHAYV